MKYPVSLSLRHKGKILELDASREMVVLSGVNGEAIGGLSWDFVIDQILAYHKVSVQKRFAPSHASPWHFGCDTTPLKGCDLKVAQEVSGAVGYLLKANLLFQWGPR